MTPFSYRILILLLASQFAFLPSYAASSEGAIPRFTDVKNKVGIKTPESLGQTAVWGDYNGDGWQDIIISDIAMRAPRSGSRFKRRSFRKKEPDAGQQAQPAPVKLLYLFLSSEGKSFSEVSGAVGLPDPSVNAASWADYNNDGYLDLVLSTVESGKPPVLFKNSDISKLADVSAPAGLTLEGSTSTNVVWADYDKDGFVDLFQSGRGKSFLYRNNGDGTFRDAAEPAGLGGKTNAYSALWFDSNNDGYPDLFLAQGGLNKFFLNNGDGTFKDATISSGLGGEEDWRTAAACAGDFNGDGYLDLYIANIGRNIRNALYRNNKDGTFTDITEETGTEDAGDGRTCAWVDFDADGRIDIYTSNHVRPSRLYRNLGGDKFKDVAPEAGIDSPIDVFAATWGDFDRDGFIDVFLNGHIGTALMKNGGNANNSLTLKLVGDGKLTNTSAIGARVEVSTPSGGLQVREVSGGRGCCEQDMLPVYFGLGTEKAAAIVVKWPGGKVCRFDKTSIDKAKELTVRETKCEIVASR